MSTNPLDRPGEVFDLELWNPNPTSSKTKDGPVYRVSFELTQETWQLFMDADTRGMLIAAKACVASEEEPKAAEPPGPYGGYAEQLYKGSFFRSPRVWERVGTDEQFLAWLRTQPCAVCRQMDYDDGQMRTVAAHIRRVAEGAGTGIKPRYCALPLCNACHQQQHQRGESALGDEDWWAMQRVRWVHLWCWQALKSQFGATSWTHVAPQSLASWAQVHDVFDLLPRCYRESWQRSPGVPA